MFLVMHFMDVGRGWTEYGRGAWRIVGRQRKIAVHSPQDIVATDAGAADGILTCNMVTPASEVKGMDAGLIVRLVDNDNYWLIAYYPDHLEIYKRKAGAYTSLLK